MRGVESDGRQHRHQFAQEIITDPRRLDVVPLRAADEVDAVLGKLGNHRAVEQFVLLRDQFVRHFRDGAILLARGQAIGRALGRVRADLLFQPGHPHFKKFVDVAGEDAEEFQPFQQRHVAVVGLCQHAALKGEYAEFAIDEGVGARKGHGLVSVSRLNDKRLLWLKHDSYMTTPPPLEIELKLALPPEQAERLVKLMARRRSEPVQQVLLTRYFDTPDFSLSAQGIALRVRRVGRRWLQTLKTEGVRSGGLSQRAEYEMAITRSTPDWTRFPAEAQAWVPEALRARLAPVFETGFSRTVWLISHRGGAQIEVALDIGEVRTPKDINTDTQRQPICEIELELKAGRPDALFALALGWARQLDYLPLDVSKAERGVRLAQGEHPQPLKSAPLALDDGMSVEDGFAAICQACLAQFQANLPGVLVSGDPEYVHQARVALRRLRAALRLYRRVCVPPDTLMDGLRTLAAALGPARDWDVLCDETLPAIAPHHDDADAWRRGLAVLEAHRAGVRSAMRTALGQAHPGAWLLAFQRWLLLRGWRNAAEAQRFIQLSPLDKWASRAQRKAHRAIARDVRVFAQLQPAQRHALRIAVKRQRYATEFFQAQFSGSRQTRYQLALRQMQDGLGRAHDAQVARSLLTAVQLDTGPMGAFVLGWLAAQQANDAGAGQLQNFVKSPVCR